MKRLLVATDLSPRSDRALNRALALFDELKAQLVVLHVLDEELPSSVADRRKEEAESAIDDQLNAFPTLNREDITRKVVFGTGVRDILKEAEESEADLIIMGTHRDESLGDLFLGTTVERVVRRGNHPVLVAKGRMKGPYQRVLVGIDFSVYSRRAVAFAVSFAPSAKFYLVHAYDVPFKGFLYGHDPRREVSKQHQLQFQQMVEEEMATFLASFETKAPKLERVMQEGGVRDVIHQQIGRLKPDLLVIGTHGRTGVARALLGSVAEDLLKAPPCDVLAVKAW